MTHDPTITIRRSALVRALEQAYEDAVRIYAEQHTVAGELGGQCRDGAVENIVRRLESP